MTSLWQDIRYGFRGLRATPGFSALAVLTLALGIGAATTMFSVIQNVLVAPFPYKDADRIVAFDVHDVENARSGGRSAFPAAEFLEYLLIGIGMAAGLAASLAVTQVLTNQLEGISPRDPATYASVILVILVAGLAACWFPAMRATRIDPMTALRFE